MLCCVASAITTKRAVTIPLDGIADSHRDPISVVLVSRHAAVLCSHVPRCSVLIRNDWLSQEIIPMDMEDRNSCWSLHVISSDILHLSQTCSSCCLVLARVLSLQISAIYFSHRCYTCSMEIVSGVKRKWEKENVSLLNWCLKCV